MFFYPEGDIYGSGVCMLSFSEQWETVFLNFVQWVCKTFTKETYSTKMLIDFFYKCFGEQYFLNGNCSEVTQGYYVFGRRTLKGWQTVVADLWYSRYATKCNMPNHLIIQENPRITQRTHTQLYKFLGISQGSIINCIFHQHPLGQVEMLCLHVHCGPLWLKCPVWSYTRVCIVWTSVVGRRKKIRKYERFIFRQLTPSRPHKMTLSAPVDSTVLGRLQKIVVNKLLGIIP